VEIKNINDESIKVRNLLQQALSSKTSPLAASSVDVLYRQIQDEL